MTANQEEISDHETFQMEFDSGSKQWYLRTMQDKYFSLQSGGGIQASETKKSANALFELLWHEDGSISFKAQNGKFIGTKKSGHLFANCDAIEENAKYYFYLINRPILVLKCDQGFVGYKANSSTVLECNKATYETFIVEKSENGAVFFKGNFISNFFFEFRIQILRENARHDFQKKLFKTSFLKDKMGNMYISTTEAYLPIRTRPTSSSWSWGTPPRCASRTD